MKRFFLTLISFLFVNFTYQIQAQETILLPDGSTFKSWEKSLKFSKTYYVDQNHSSASDDNSGTESNPFKTINKAAQVIKPGERVVIASGTYRELICPQSGGNSPTEMISYEAAPGARVIVKGSRVVEKEGWEPSTGFNLRNENSSNEKIRIYQYDLESLEFNGYNPFGVSNIMWDRRYFPFSQMADEREKFKPHAFRRGMIFIGDKKLEQVELYRNLADKVDAFWVEHNGLTVHVRLKDDADPSEFDIEFVVQEQVFAPKKRHLGYIRIMGIIFEHGANGFPVPQRGIVSTNRGHHWILEDCAIRYANAVGLDIGNETWNADIPPLVGYHIVRRNHIEDAGICGIAGMRAVHTLVESNIIENIGWHDTERSWESAGIKFHQTENNVFRNNIIKNVIYAPGLWLDYDCKNTRVTNNIICDIYKTRRAAIYLEASQFPNMIDHNIIWNVTTSDYEATSEVYHNGMDGGWGILNDGSDEGIIAHNLFGYCQNSAFKSRSIETRIVTGRGGTSRWNKVINNIFYRCVRGIDFNNEHNYAEGNLYLKKGYELGDILNRVYKPERLLLDLPAWQKFFGFDKSGAYADMDIECDTDQLAIILSVSGDIPEIETEDSFKSDFSGKSMGKTRLAGPFGKLPATSETISIDPQK